MSTELARAEQAPIVITTPEAYHRALAEWQKHYNVLTPFTSMIGVAPSHGLMASVVKLDTDPTHGDVYSGYLPDGRKGMPFLKGDRGAANEELAPAKIGLRKLAECGAISTDAVRTDNGLIRNYWSFKAFATYKGLDGSRITRSASFEWDLRDGSDRLKGWTPQQIGEGRKNGLRNCEARAINAAIRECGCGIKQKYTRAELDKPFLVVRVAFLPDMDDPEIKRMVTAQALGNTSALYTNAGRALPDAIDAAPESEPKHVGRGTTTPSAPATPEAPKADEKPTPDAVKVVSISLKTGEKNGRPWTKWTIVDSEGNETSTFSKTCYEDAERFKASGEWVEIAHEMNGQYRNLIEIVKAGTQPDLAGLDPDAKV